MTFLQSLSHSPIVHGAITGALASAVVDFQAFKTWTTFHDFVTFNWATAAFRWLQGAVLGAVAGVGLGAL